MPPPLLKKVLIAAEWVAILAISASVLSQPPQSVTEATANALYSVLLNTASEIGPAGLLLTKGTPIAVIAVWSSVPASKVRTGSLDPFLTKLLSAFRALY